jgi:hypothetical protein
MGGLACKQGQKKGEREGAIDLTTQVDRERGKTGISPWQFKLP